MGLKGIMLSEIIQRQIPHALTYMWNLKHKTKQKNQNKIQTQREQIGSCQRGGDLGRADWVKEVKRHKLLCIK